MKKILPILFVLIIACTNPADCVKSSGALATKNFDNIAFDRILVFKGINLVIAQGTSHKISVSTGENLIGDIDISVQNGQLQIRDKTSCNWVRDYGETVVTILTPTLSEIYSKTEGSIISNGSLNFPSLKLIASDNFDGLGGSGTGDFQMNINNQNIEIVNNSYANFDISGTTNRLNIAVFEGNGKIKAQNCIAQNIEIYHRGSNGIWVDPVLSIKGSIINVGNVYCNSKPPLVDVSAFFRGQLIF